jgi:hypothetical protein
MPRPNTRHSVFQHINMHGGDRNVCWEWLLVAGGGKGRGKPRPYISIGGRKIIVTRIVYELMKGVTLSDDDLICHTCDNSICCNPDHLYIGTHEDNTNDMVSRDRHGLPSHVVRRIRTLLDREPPMTHQAIGDLYGVDRSVITRIANNKLHTHVNDYPSKEESDGGEQSIHRD